MKRRNFLLLCAAAIVPRQRTIQVREPYWTVNTDAVYQLKQRITYAGDYQWKYRYLTASGETLAANV